MLLHCEREGGPSEDGATPAAAWLGAAALDSLIELNELCLSLLAEQAAVRSGPPSGLLQQLSELWHRLDGASRHRAAACPYLLLDAGFADPLRWQIPPARQVGDGGSHRYACYFTVPAAAEVARLVFIYAWHLARSHAVAARLLLGMPESSAALIGRYTLRQIQTLAENHLDWLRPRWPARVQVWRKLLVAATSGEMAALERARLWGLTLLAAEARFAPVASASRAGARAEASRHFAAPPSG